MTSPTSTTNRGRRAPGDEFNTIGMRFCSARRRALATLGVGRPSSVAGQCDASSPPGTPRRRPRRGPRVSIIRIFLLPPGRSTFSRGRKFPAVGTMFVSGVLRRLMSARDRSVISVASGARACLCMPGSRDSSVNYVNEQQAIEHAAMCTRDYVKGCWTSKLSYTPVVTHCRHTLQ